MGSSVLLFTSVRVRECWVIGSDQGGDWREALREGGVWGYKGELLLGPGPTQLLLYKQHSTRTVLINTLFRSLECAGPS